MREAFRRFAQRAADIVGSPRIFAVAMLLILLWALAGPAFHYSDTWQLVVNTGTSIVTFLMVFLIQSTQNRDTKALHLKLDELIRAVQTARNTFIDLEHFTEDELEHLQKEFQQVYARAGRSRRVSSPPEHKALENGQE